MAKRISSLFTSKDSSVDLPRSHSTPRLDAEMSPSRKLTKPMTKSPSDVRLNTRLDSELEPPPMFTNTGITSRPVSREGRSPLRSETGGSRRSSSSRPQTPTTLSVPGTGSPIRNQSPSTNKVSKRRSWIPGKSGEKYSPGHEEEQMSCQAWIAGLKEEVPYDLTKLLTGEPVEDMWDENGDVVVYLYPEASRKGPSFRVSSLLFADSRVFSYLAQSDPQNGSSQPSSDGGYDPVLQMGSLSLQDQYNALQYSPQSSNGATTHFSRPLYNPPPQRTKTIRLPLGLEGDFSRPGTIASGDDLELIVLYRNFFAFLRGGALIATRRQNSLYAIFMSISSILRRLNYGNEKGSSWGAVPWASFSRYTEELRLADVRSSREKNVEAILMGVAMKSWPLYAEGFSHAVGRFEDIKSINSPKFDKIPPAIINRMERAYHDLKNNRLLVLHSKLDNFDFPSMFSGIANSTTATEAKVVNFKGWKTYFMDFRQYTMAQYKKKYGSWPPKARSKKNNFEEDGLNRLLIREVYENFTDIYDLFVDRTSITTRTNELLASISDDAQVGSRESIQHALRMIESEYDRSSLPVAPPIPFDVPLIPSYPRYALARDAQVTKRLKDNELQDILLGSYNQDSLKQNEWLSDFLDYERKLCYGKSVQDLADVRCGQWLFMYAVLQALPMTVVDARDLQYTEKVEYFLCEAPRGGRPWMDADESTSRAWFNVASGGGLVSMPADTIDHSVEGIYRRSHCWLIANKWAEALGPISPIHTYQPSHAIGFPVPESKTPHHTSPFLAPRSASANPSPYNSPFLNPVQATDVVPTGDEGSLGLPRVSSRNSMQLGLQEVAPPARATVRPKSLYNPNVTFDNIFASQNIQQKKGKKEKK